jgi:hypothetical protein
MTPAGHSGVGRVEFGVEQVSDMVMMSAPAPMNYSKLKGPALYRSPNRSAGPDNVAHSYGAIEDFEVPAFLRKGSMPITNIELLARAIIRVFHDALDDGHEYRQAIRLVANAKFNVPLEPAIEVAKAEVKSSLKAWGCLLMWASDKAGYTHGFTDHTLLLVMGQLSGVDEDDQAKAIDAIDHLFLTQALRGLIDC